MNALFISLAGASVIFVLSCFFTKFLLVSVSITSSILVFTFSLASSRMSIAVDGLTGYRELMVENRLAESFLDLFIVFSCRSAPRSYCSESIELCVRLVSINPVSCCCLSWALSSALLDSSSLSSSFP